MRKSLMIAIAVTAVLGITAIAYAVQVNTYKVQASNSPTKSGTLKKPTPILTKFSYQVGEATGQRPALITDYTIGFGVGIAANSALFPTCDFTKINLSGSTASCPRGSIVGGGTVNNNAGATSNQADKGIVCKLNLTLVNGKSRHLILFLKGGPPACPIDVAQAINGRLIPFKGGQALAFHVPDTLQHPLPPIDNAVVDVTSTVNKKSVLVRKRVRGRTTLTRHGYFETNKCLAGHRTVTVQFTASTGAKSLSTARVRCTK